MIDLTTDVKISDIKFDYGILDSGDFFYWRNINAIITIDRYNIIDENFFFNQRKKMIIPYERESNFSYAVAVI